MIKSHIPHSEQDGFVITSPKIKEVYKEINDYAFHGRPCILFGPTGAGKEFVARHYFNTFKNAGNPDAPFKSLNCAGLTEDLAVSELFGHMKGSFTGAMHDKPGLFEKAIHGVLFLDEIGDIPEKVQSMLLRAVDPGTYEARRLGSNENYSTENVIVICATDRPRNALREPLLNRLGHQVFIPGVEERQDDIPPAVLFFVKAALLKRKDKDELINKLFSINDDKEIKSPEGGDPWDYLAERISIRLTPLIESKPWPGNFREIRNAVDTAVIRAKKANGVEMLIVSVKHYYDLHLKNINVIKTYKQSYDLPRSNKTQPISQEELLYDESMLEKIREALPRIKEDEKKIWASFFSQIGNRLFYRNEIDLLLPLVKGRAILNRLKALENSNLVKRGGIRGDEYILNTETPATISNNVHDESEFKLPELNFIPDEREKEIVHVVELISNTRGIFISGEKQSGKTTFVFVLGKKLMQLGFPVFYHAFEENGLSELFQNIIDKLQSNDDLNLPNLNTKDSTSLPLIAATLTGYLNTLFVSSNHPIMILDNTDIIKSESEIKTLNIMLTQWNFFTFVLVGKKLGNNLRMGEHELAEHKIKIYRSGY